MANIPQVIDAITNPQVSVPVSGVGLFAQLVQALPHAVTGLWCIYVLLLIAHKLWKMHKEWRGEPTVPEKGFGDE